MRRRWVNIKVVMTTLYIIGRVKFFTRNGWLLRYQTMRLAWANQCKEYHDVKSIILSMHLARMRREEFLRSIPTKNVH